LVVGNDCVFTSFVWRAKFESIQFADFDASKVAMSSVYYLSGIAAFARNLREPEQAFAVFAWRDRVKYTIPAEEVARSNPNRSFWGTSFDLCSCVTFWMSNALAPNRS
jgi:hypothetical protein